MDDTETFQGYFNYWVLGDTKHFKTYNFSDKTEDEVEVLRAQFSNPAKYSFIGANVVPQTKKSKN